MKMSLLNNTILHLLNFEKYSSFEQALKAAAISNNYQVVLLSMDFNPLIVVETRDIITVEEVVNTYKSMGAVDHDGYRFIEVKGVKNYWGVVELLGEKYYLLLTDNDDAYGETEMTRIAEIIELAMGMWKYTPERDAKAEIVRALLRGNVELALALKDEAKLDAKKIVSVVCASGYDREFSGKILREFTKKGLLETYAVEEDNRVYALVVCADNASAEDIEVQTSLINLFDKLKEQEAIKIYHVTGIHGLEGASDAFRMISETIPFVGSIFPYKRVFSKYELILVSNCIAIQMQGGRLLKNYQYILKPFKDGSNKSHQLLETLQTFVLDSGMSSAKTAAIMDVHTNTVQYRLKRINEILGIEITANRIIPGLTVAIALNRLENTPD